MPTCDAILPAPMCRLGARFDGDALTRLDFLPLDTPVSAQLDARAEHLARELAAYWDDAAHAFNLRFELSGTPFQQRVWRALMAIPPGQPTTYGALAKQLGTAARAVGQACGSNPLPILVPCHRVVAANGLGGFMHAAAGAPLDVKTWLLVHEQHAPDHDDR
ncbi:MAG: cysteine methyltransferase [Hydrogenophilales bacterium RIFOXYD1_FULL_62_11]|nr:MAG: cysteine methyltransferase [Hydrogenophilales bacterium RIFOXYD1_FULL_62_11]